MCTADAARKSCQKSVIKVKSTEPQTSIRMVEPGTRNTVVTDTVSEANMSHSNSDNATNTNKSNGLAKSSPAGVG